MVFFGVALYFAFYYAGNVHNHLRHPSFLFKKKKIIYIGLFDDSRSFFCNPWRADFFEEIKSFAGQYQ